MNEGMDAEDFRRWVDALAALHPTPSHNVVAVVRCEEEWRTVFADGSWHPGRPYPAAIMDELAQMVDDYRVEARELRGLAELWRAIETEAEAAADAVAEDPAAPQGIIDVEIVEEIRRPTARGEVARIELRDLSEVSAPAEEPVRTPRVRTGAENFVPWSVVESMIDVELDGYFTGPS